MTGRALFAGLLLLAVCRPGAAVEPAPCRSVTEGSLTFTAEQAGAPVRGRFGEFSARICFAPETATGSFHVEVRMRSVSTGNADRDAALKSADFFHVEQYPLAVYEADRFEVRPDGGFVAHGRLRLRGVTRPEPVRFTFRRREDGTALLEGSATLQRLDYGVGQGEWRDTTWVGNRVEVGFSLQLAPAVVTD